MESAAPSAAASARDLVQTVLDTLSIFVMPDWKALIALLPVLLALLFLAWFALTFRKFATLGPTRRAPARIPPITPASVHMPGGSAAPIVVAFGGFALFLGLVLGGIWLAVGGVVMVMTLLVWMRDALRDYDHLEAASTLPALIHEGPPPGVHMPGPSIRPLMGALGSAALLGGLVVGGWVLVLAVIFLVYTLLGWLFDATAEYRKTVEADKTGHLENIPAIPLPMRSLQVFALAFVLLGLAQAGLLPTAPAAGGTGTPGASGAPATSGQPGGGGEAPAGSLPITAQGFAFLETTLEVPAGQPFTIYFTNKDPAGTAHDVELRSTDGKVLQQQPPTDGGKSQAYTYDALQPGTYTYICSIHPIPAMTGTLTVK
ncbi:MAG TPA: cupredoxin domain-containing protein [Candidatus Limnocylindrales bacterium]|nr:cupredoxin domain-containing protein [Candidatus Limnocylindrales bacterium]